MINTKKLVVNFLILAGLTGGVIWFFSGIKPSNQLALGTQNLKIATTDGSLLDRNYSSPSGKTNLTELVANNLVEEAILAEAGGSSSSTIRSMSDQLKPEEIQSLLKENISTFTPVAEKDLLVSESDTVKGRLNYLHAVNEILRATVGSSELNELATQSLSPELIEPIKLIFDQAVAELIKVPAPKSLLPAHQKLLVFLSQYQKILASVADYKSDPVKTMTLLDVANAFNQYNLQSFQETLKEIPPPRGTIPTSIKPSSLIDELLGVKTALALSLLGDVPVDCSGTTCSDLVVAEIDTIEEVTKAVYKLFDASLKEWSKVQPREELKNQLVELAEQQSMDLVQGASKPKYVQNWRQETGNAGDRASEAVIKKETPELCNSFRSVTKLALGDRGAIMNGSEKNCSLKDAVPNTDDFYNDFDKGGWNGYFEALKPENNLFGSIIILNDKASQAGAEAAEAARSENESGQGFRSSKTCVNRGTYTLDNLKEKGVMEAGVTVINLGETSYYANALGEDYIEGTLTTAGTPAVAGTIAGTEFQTCQRDGWEITNPGNVTGQILNNSLALATQRIIQSQDSSSTALTRIQTNSSLNRLIRAEERGPDSNGIMDVYRGPEPPKLNDIIISPSNPNPQAHLIACFKMSGNAKAECLLTISNIKTIRSIIDDPSKWKNYLEEYAKNYVNDTIDQIKTELLNRIRDEAKDLITKSLCNLAPSFGGVVNGPLECKLNLPRLLPF